MLSATPLQHRDAVAPPDKTRLLELVHTICFALSERIRKPRASGAEVLLTSISAAAAWALLVGGEPSGWIAVVATGSGLAACWSGRTDSRLAALSLQLFLSCFLLVLSARSGVWTGLDPCYLAWGLFSTGSMLRLGWLKHSECPPIGHRTLDRFFPPR